MNEQLLKDFIATAQKYNYNWDTTFSKFPELKDYDQQLLKDYVATAEKENYNYDVVNSKFPEFGFQSSSTEANSVGLKKKDITASSSGVGSLVSSEPAEEDYFQGAFGSVLRGLDSISPIGIGDFVDDMARSVAAGYRNATVAEEADNLLLAGAKATPEEIQKFIEANKSASQIGQSKEMQDYMKTYEEEGKSFWGVVKGILTNPTVGAELITSSLTALATNADALKAGAAAIGTGAAYGAATGAAAGGVGAIPGAGAGAAAAIPYAFGLASSVVEAGSTFGELLQEELGGKELTKENVRAILEDENKLQEIRNKAIARGMVIGAANAFTGKLASSVGAKILTKSAAKSATGAATKGAVTKATAAGAGVEAVGGSLGEAAARGAIGQDMDVSEIALEGIAELPGGVRSTIQARLAKPEYKVNGVVATKEQVDELIETMSPADLAKTKIDIKNDYEGRQFKVQDKITTHSITEQVRQANPDLNEPSLNAIVELEKQLRALEGNTTQTGKDKSAAIRSQIKDIQENQLQEEVAAETVKAEAPESEIIPEEISNLEDDAPVVITVKTLEEVPAQFRDRAEKLEGAEIKVREKILGLPIGKETTKVVNDGYRYKLTGKEVKDYAIQEQTAGQVPVQPTAGVSETVEQGEPQAEPQVVAQEGEAKGEEVTKPEIIREDILSLSDEQITPLYDEIPLNLMPDEELGLSPQDAVFEAYYRSKKRGTNPELVSAVENLFAQQKETQPSRTVDQEVSMLESMLDQDEQAQSTTTGPQLLGVEIGPTAVVASNTDAIRGMMGRAKSDVRKSSVLRMAAKAVKTLKSIFPDMDIVLHEDSESYNNALSKLGVDGRDSKGTFNYGRDNNGKIAGGRIDIDMSSADAVTVAHEVAHAILLKAFGENPAVFKDFRNRISKILADSTLKELNDFASQYSETQSHEEFIVQFTGLLSNEGAKIPESTIQKIAAVINDVVSKLTGGAIKPFEGTVKTKEVIDFLNTMSSAIAQGEAIKVSDGGSMKQGAKITSKAQLSTDGTGVKLLGDEPLMKGKNAPTVSTDTKGYIDDYSVDDIMNTVHAPNSRVVTVASNMASGQIVYNKDGEKIVLQIPYKETALKNKIEALRLEYKNVTGSSKAATEKKNKIKSDINKITKRIISDFTDFMSQNLLALYDTLTPEFIKNSREWYVGANRMANAIANKYNITIEQVSGIMAVLSPQNDWFNNVSVAERAIEVLSKYSDTKLTKDIVDKAVAYNSDKSTGEKNDFASLITAFFDKNGEVSINELQSIENSIEAQALILRAFDHALHSPKVAMTDPTGKFIGYDTTPVRWNSGGEIAKAIIVFRNKDVSVINQNLGNGNKVRNFYNNIVDPHSTTPYVTADTHAASAALNIPMSAKDASGFGLFNGSLEPIYAMVKGAYINAAAIAGTEPREMQSITWEAQRIGINDKNRTAEAKNNIFNHITESRKDKKTPYERATELIARNRSGDPTWGKSRGIETQKSSEEIRRDVGVRANERISSLSNLRGRTKGGVGKSRTEMGGGASKQGKVKTTSKAQVKEGEGKYKVAIVFKGKYGGMVAKPYEFNNKQHFENWMKKYATKFGVKDFYELNSKSQLSRVRGAEKVVELGRGSGFSDDAIRTVLQKKGYSQAEIDQALKNKKAAKAVVVDEVFAEGYERMMGQVDGIIEKGLTRGTSQEKILENVLNYVRGSNVYEKATAQQQEQMTRDVKEAFGEKMKAAPSSKKILGLLNDVKNITINEMELLKQRFKEATKTERAIKKSTMSLVDSLKDLKKKGVITTSQMMAVLRKFSKVKHFSDESISKFVDYMAKVFSDAEYADKISKALSQVKQAKKNIKTKIGISEQLYPLLNRMFSINPSLIPDAVFDQYLGLLDMFSQKDKVLALSNKEDVTNLAREINDAIDEELSLSEELAIRFDEYEDKVLDADGKLDYAATIQAMLNDNVITEDEAKLMKKYKSKISPSKQKVKKTDAELEAERQGLITAVSGSDVDTENLPTHDEREVARKLERLIKSDAVKRMTIEQLTNLMRVIDNINNGYLPHYAQLMLERLNAISNGSILAKAIAMAKPLSLTRVYANLKRIFTRKEAITEMVRRSPLAYIDQLFGNFKTKDIFDSLFKAAAEAQTLFRSNVNKIQNTLDEAQNAVARSFSNDPNKTLMSKFKMMAYLVELEYQSNPNSKQVNPVIEHLKATIKHIDEGKSSFGERDANMLQEILDKYAPNGEMDVDKLFRSFNEAERNAIKTIREVNDSLIEKAVHTSAIVRGDKINLLENYIHLNVLHESQPDDAISGVSSAEAYNNSLRPSTKAKSLISRTGKVTPLNFDVFASAQRGANFILMDYYLTEPIRTARKTINEAIAIMEEDGRIPKEKRQILNAISSAFEESTENLLNNVFITNSFADDVANYLSKSGYRAVLASVPRFIAELTSNISFALFTDPKALSSGFKYKDIVMSSDAVKILNNLGSKQTNRIFPHEALVGRLIDSSIMSQASGIKGGRAKNDVANVIQMLYNNSIKKYKNSVEALADALISTPDKIVMRPLWIGSFANEFKRITGEDVDFEKVSSNDEAYMLENKDALDDARDIADQRSVLTGATDNAYMDILKGKVKHDQSALARAFNIFNNYMTRFAIYEYSAARTGIMAAMGNGSLSRKQGVALMAGVTSRMMLYTLLAQSLGSGMVDMFTGDDDEEEDEKSLGKKIGQAMTSTFTSLLIGRDFGNATKTFVNYGLERFNEKYLDNLREGTYDPYKDAIQYTIVPPDSKGSRTDLNDFLMNMGGPFGPSLKTANLIARKLTEEPKKEEDAIERSEKEFKVRIPLEVLGNVGLIPMYKDVRKVVMKNIYKDLDKADKATETKQDDFKPYGLNKNELKKYMPEVYDQYYGEGTTYEQQRSQKAKLRKKKDALRKKLLDEKYNYISGKKKKSDSKEFGSGEFGSKKFGEE